MFNNESEYFGHAATQQANRTVEKPVVKYQSIGKNYLPEVGKRYSMVPVDHPAAYLNGIMAVSSTVVAVNGTSFETMNTRYELAE